MKKSVVTLVTLIILTAGPTVQGQVDPKLQAEEKAKEAIKLMDNGKLVRVSRYCKQRNNWIRNVLSILMRLPTPFT